MKKILATFLVLVMTTVTTTVAMANVNPYTDNVYKLTDKTYLKIGQDRKLFIVNSNGTSYAVYNYGEKVEFPEEVIETLLSDKYLWILDKDGYLWAFNIFTYELAEAEMGDEVTSIYYNTEGLIEITLKNYDETILLSEFFKI